jgi:DNA repair photolyase
MSLNPEPIADLWEGKFPDTLERMTPPIERRLEALRAAQDMGFEVRARIDPILTPAGWEEHYAAFFADMAHRHGLRPTMLTLGSHREKMAQLDTFRAKWGLPAPEWEAEVGARREGTHHHMVGREDVYRRVRDMIVRAFKGTGHEPWISLCKETHGVRRATSMQSANCNCLPETAAPKHRLALYGEVVTKNGG